MKKRQLSNNQRGIISILVTMVMIVVISLIVLGLAGLSRREQRQALDNHLSTQAYYAAESGVNDVIGLFKAGNPGTKNSCANTGAYSVLNTKSQLGSATSGVSYTCVTVDTTPGTLTKPISSSPQVFSLATSDGSAPGTVRLSWPKGQGRESIDVSQCPSYAQVSAKNPVFTNMSSWTCPYPVLRVDVVFTNPSAFGGMTRSFLMSNLKTVFVVPTPDSAVTPTMTYLQGTSEKPNFRDADCDNTSCYVNLSNLTQNLATGTYYLRASALYVNSTLNITDTNPAINFSSQTFIDSTGKAQDVLRRIKVAVDTSPGNFNASIGAALVSGDSICKRFVIYDSSVGPNAPGVCSGVVSGAGGGSGSGNALFNTGTGGGSGSGSGGGGGPFWTRNFTNASANPINIVTGCRWDWGDGTSSNNVACNAGDSTSHLFPMIATCTFYNVVLTVNTTLGIYTYNNTVKEPHGSASGC